MNTTISDEKVEGSPISDNLKTNTISETSIEDITSSFQDFPAGTLVIPMDNDLQGRNNSLGGYNLMSYGLVVRLLHADIPVQWAINSTKAKDGIDFSANSKRVYPSETASGNFNFKGGAFVIQPGKEAEAEVIINEFNNSIIPGLGLNNNLKVKVNVYELTAITPIEIKHVLLHKPKAAVLNNGGNEDIHVRMLQYAGLVEGDFYELDLLASDIEVDDCYTFISEAHAEENSVAEQEVNAIKAFVLSGGNFLAQCAAGRSYEQFDDIDGRLLTADGLTDPGIDGNIIFDNPSDPIIQIVGPLADEGGSAKSYRPINGYQAGASVHRHAYDSNDGGNYKVYGGKVAGSPSIGGNVYYLAGHDYKDNGIEYDNGFRVYLNAFLMPSFRPEDCGLTIQSGIRLYKSGEFNDENGDGCSNLGETINYTFLVNNIGNVSLSNVHITDPIVTVDGGPITLAPNESDSTTFSATYTITQDDINNEEVINQATAFGAVPNGVIVSDLSDNIDVIPFTGDPLLGQIYTTVQDGSWNSSSTWNASGVPPIDLGNGDVVNINHRVEMSQTLKMAGNAILNNNNNILKFPDGNLEIENEDVIVNINNSLVIIVNGIFINKSGTVNFINGAVQLCDDGYKDESDSPNGTFGSGYIYALNGNIESLGSGNFSDLINWCSVNGNGVNLPIPENCPLVAPPTGCEDESFFIVNEDDPTIVTLTNCKNPEIALIKVGHYDPIVDGQCESEVGDEITYTFSVKNTGDVPLTNVMVTDVIGGVTMSGGPIDLAIGEEDTTTFTATYSITEDDIIAGVFVNQAEAIGTPPMGLDVTDLSDDNSYDEDDSTMIPLCQKLQMALVMEGEVVTVAPFTALDCYDEIRIDYTYKVSNEGNVKVTDIVLIHDDIDIGPIDGPTGDDGNNILDLGEVWIYTSSYEITEADREAGEVITQSVVSGVSAGEDIGDLSDDDSPLEDDETIILLCVPSPAIALIKGYTLLEDEEEANGCLDLGETILYNFSVKNTGNVTLYNITITDPLPGLILEGGPITLAPDEEDTTTFTASYLLTDQDFQEDEDGNIPDLVNQATVEGTTIVDQEVSDLSHETDYELDGPTVISFDCNTTTIFSFEPIFVKGGVWQDDDGDLNADAGELVLYTFSLHNPLDETIYNITIEDDMLPGLIIEGGPIESLAPGETDNTTFTAYYFLTEDDVEHEIGEIKEVVNQATAYGENFDGSESGSILSDSDDPNLPGLEDPTVVILPFVEGEEAWDIFNGVTPNGDLYNDYFKIKGIQNYPDNNVKIYNRWGVLIWETNGYEYNEEDPRSAPANSFTGDADARMLIEGNKNAPTGTYFYVITLLGDGPFPENGKRNFSGYLYLNR